MDADILTMSSKGQISIPAKIRKEMSVSIGNKFVIYLWYKCQKYKNSVQACLQKNLLSFDTQKIWVSSHFLQKKWADYEYFCKNCEKRSCSNPVSMGVKYFWHPHHIYMAIQ